MKTLRPLLLIVILVLVAIPLVIAAQDNSDDLDDIFVPLPGDNNQSSQPSGTLVIGTANPCADCIEYPSNELNLTPGQINLPLAQTPTEELIEYPTQETEMPDCDSDPTTLLIEDCPTATPTPRPPATPQNQSSVIVNGLWIQEPGGESFSSSGQCQAEYGDNDGPPNYGSEEEIPRVPACVSGDNQWLSVNNNGPFPRVLEGIYSTQEFSRSLIETGGETTGSVNVTTRREYRVISPTQIEFSYTIQEDGGCTRTSTIRYKMVEPNEMVCSGTLITPEATLMSTPVSTAQATPQPGETPAPTQVVEPPVKSGPYVIELPPVDDRCAADQMPPSSQVAVSYDTNQNLFINFGGSSYTLYWDGDTYYQYRKGNRFMVSVVTYDGGASLNWGNNGCYVSSPLAQEGAPTSTPVPVEPTSEAHTDAGSMAGSSFSTTWDAPANMCAEENKALLPDLSGAVLTAQADGSFLFSVGGSDYVLTNTDGIHGYTEMGADGSMLSIGMNGFYEGEGMGSFSLVTSDGQYCIAMLTFKPS